jgi:hypothetical protein
MTTTARHIEADALAGLREELMRAATRRHSSRRRARRAAVAAAIVVGLLAATAGAAELSGFTTGVPVVDELIGIDASPNHHPGPGDATKPLSVPIGDGVYQTVAYLARDGSVCIVSAERHRGSVRGSGGGCPPLTDVNRGVERRGAVWQGSSHGLDSRTNQFLVAGDVETIRPLGEGDWKVLMTPPWTPHAPDARPLRLAVVIDDADVPGGEDGMQMGELPPEAFNEPTLELTYSDGHTRVWEGRQAK